MKIIIILGVAASFLLGSYTSDYLLSNNPKKIKTSVLTDEENELQLGIFSLSMSVKDLKVSKEFYEKLGFVVLGGAMEQNYLIMKSENTVIGLFHGMFEGNALTFNPGWDANGENVEEFDDIRVIQKHLVDKGININPMINVDSEGPASFMITDPDGNLLIFDQHR